MRIYLLLGIELALIGTIAAYLTPVPTQFESRVWIRIKGDRPILTGFSIIESSVVPRTLVQMIKNPDVLATVFEDPSVSALPEFQATSSPIELLAERISVEETGSELYEIVYETEHKSSAHIVVNTLAATFVKKRFHERILESECDEYCTILKRKRAALKLQASEHLQNASADLRKGPSAQSRPTSKLPPNLVKQFGQLTEVSVGLLNLNAEMELIQRQNSGNATNRVTVYDHALAVERVAEVTRLAERRRTLLIRVYKANDNKQEEQMQSEIQSLDRQLSSARAAARAPAMQNHLAEVKRADGVRLDQIKLDIERLNSKASSHRAQIAEEKSVLSKTITERELNLLIANEETRHLRETVSRIDDRIRVMRIEMSSPERVEQLSEATAQDVTVSRRAVSEQRLVNALAVALFLPLFLAVFTCLKRRLEFAWRDQ